MSASTIITHEHATMLEGHGIAISSTDVAPMAAYQYEAKVNEAVANVTELFDEVRARKKVPLAELRNDVLPMIQETAYGSNLLGLFASLQAKDDYTYRHNVAVGAIANLIGTWMKLDHQELLQLTTAALLHDVGKMLVPLHILNKPGRLTAEEYIMMKNHTVLGYELLKETVGINHKQALVALQHHERMDGSGYPFGLTGEKIGLFSRIVSVADIFHAMTSVRVYRTPSPFYEVLYQMERDAFGALDPAITRLFIEKVMNGLIGHPVQLTDGSQGTILMVHTHDPTHPLVQVGSEFIDLAQDLSLRIKRIVSF